VAFLFARATASLQCVAIRRATSKLIPTILYARAEFRRVEHLRPACSLYEHGREVAQGLDVPSHATVFSGGKISTDFSNSPVILDCRCGHDRACTRLSGRRLSASSQPSPETQPPEPIHSVSTIPHPRPTSPPLCLVALPLPCPSFLKEAAHVMCNARRARAQAHRNGSSAHSTQPVTLLAHAHATDYASAMSKTVEKYTPGESNTDVERAVRLPSCPPPSLSHGLTRIPTCILDIIVLPF
jgi:hypothetical protein